VLKLATLPNSGNKAAIIWELCRREKLQIFGSPDTLGEYHRVLANHPLFLEEIQAVIELCYPFFTATAIEHEPDNRFLEVALAAQADYLVTVNTARGHSDRNNYDMVRVVTPGEFLNWREAQGLLAVL